MSNGVHDRKKASRLTEEGEIRGDEKVGNLFASQAAVIGNICDSFYRCPARKWIYILYSHLLWAVFSVFSFFRVSVSKVAR